MFTSVVAALALAASVSQVAASPINHIARNYAQDAELLEDYTPYHVRYIALGCTGKQGSDFFEECCHPLLKWQKLSDRPSQCIPSASASSSAALAEPSAPVVDEEPLPDVCDDDEDDDECTDASSSSYGQPTSKLIGSYSAAATTTSKSAAYVAPETTSKSAAAEPTSKSVAPETVKSKYSAPEPTTTVKPTTVKETYSAAPTKSAAPSTGGGDVFSGGFATFFSQGGVAGACGTVHSDDDFIVAADSRRYGALDKQSSLCGKKVHITNPKNGKSVTATVADACPTCENNNSLDLSKGAFDQIATRDEGMVLIDWYFV